MNLGFLMKFLPILKGLNWVRIGLIGTIAAGLFTGGVLWSDKQHAEHEADFEKAKAVAISALEKKLNDEWFLRLYAEEDARLTLQSELATIREHRDSLINEIRDASLVKPITDIKVEACLETEDENVQLVIANPFSSDFRRVYNRGSRGVTRIDEEAGPETN